MDDTTEGLENQLESFSISSTDERMANKLANTHISPRNMFGNPSTKFNLTTPPAPAPIQKDKKKNEGWGDEDEGWGKGPPSYTSLIQGTYFGFNSIMEPSPEVSQESPTPEQSQAFNRYKDKQTTFLSALNDLDKQ